MKPELEELIQKMEQLKEQGARPLKLLRDHQRSFPDAKTRDRSNERLKRLRGHLLERELPGQPTPYIDVRDFLEFLYLIRDSLNSY